MVQPSVSDDGFLATEESNLGNEGSAAPQGAADPQFALRVTGAEKRFGNVTALGGVDLNVAAGEFVTLLGPSGCGKSTLLRIVAGIETPTGGRVEIGGKVVTEPAARVHVPPEKRGLGMVFQSYAVWPHMTVAQNVMFPLRYNKVPRSERKEAVRRALAKVRMEPFAERYPHQLSGGQQQRVALARALVAHPTLLLLDEPLSNLDARLREDMRVELKRLHVELGLSMLYVTHDQSEALAMSDRILVMDAGKVLQEGSPEEVYRTPISLTVAKFLGVKTMLPARAGSPGTVEFEGLVLPARFPEPIDVGSPVVVAVRSDGFVSVARDDPTGFTGVVELVEFLGSAYEYEIKVAGHTLVMVHPEYLGARGDQVTVSIKPDGATAFAVAADDQVMV